MNRHKQNGFTVIELVVVIIVIALLSTITTIAYRTTQSNARDEKRKSDALMLKAAVEEYYADMGTYPSPVCDGVGGMYECHNNEAWNLLVSQGYLSKVPSTGLSGNYRWLYSSPTRYGIYVPLEGASPNNHCKTGRNMTSTWWSSAPDCGV
ncbi:hypothetical protein B7Z17_00465 [Candidatus Saccharibacteria bacterium 32-49-10]|nr:MAG: hypothetical protein B7Z17_00465 [Candidatus Saccharibacteria bacterium 32-49-10]